ncbi:MAG: IS1595 family transposase [Rubrobacter sp.]|jgi:transposase-like protein|nr:IS1595 family transposase [Rubrobacter sp.]
MLKEQDINLVSLVERYHSEDSCRARLEELRWPAGVECPRCGSAGIARMEDRRQYQCRSCRYQFSVTAGTIFHDSPLPLWKWFLAVYLIIESKKGISANQLKRTLGVSYKTAWYLCHRIRAALNEVDAQLLKGIAEVDETFVGGEMHGNGRGYKGNKTVVVGAMQRGGNICLKVVRGADRETLHGFIRENTADGTEAIYTDEWPAYRGIADGDTEHKAVKHRSGEYARGEVHTNSIENVWSLLKRSIIGSYHQVSAKHLDAYLDELEFRYNNRENPYLFRDALCKLLVAETLPYARLISD